MSRQQYDSGIPVENCIYLKSGNPEFFPICFIFRGKSTDRKTDKDRITLYYWIETLIHIIAYRIGSISKPDHFHSIKYEIFFKLTIGKVT